MARHTFSRRTPYYFEARKRYAGGFDLFVTGWLVMSDYRLEVTHVTAAVTDQDYKGLETASVLGVVELADRAVWVLEAHGYESETYVLMEFDPDEAGRARLRIGGGGCWERYHGHDCMTETVLAILVLASFVVPVPLLRGLTGNVVSSDRPHVRGHFAAWPSRRVRPKPPRGHHWWVSACWISSSGRSCCWESNVSR